MKGKKMLKRIVLCVCVGFALHGAQSLKQLNGAFSSAQQDLQAIQQAIGTVRARLSSFQNQASQQENSIRSCPGGGLANVLIQEAQRLAVKTIDKTVGAIQQIGLPSSIEAKIIQKIN